MKNKWFTLIELIVSIWIIMILAASSSFLFGQYMRDARNTARITSLQNISSSLEQELFRKWYLPEPDNKITITSWAIILWYQWTFGDNATSNTQWITVKQLDPKDDFEYIYNINEGKNKYQIMWYLEKESEDLSYTEKVYAQNFSIMDIKTLWNELGIIVNSDDNEALTSSWSILTWDIYDPDFPSLYNIILTGSNVSFTWDAVKNRLIKNYGSIECWQDHNSDINSRPTKLCSLWNAKNLTWSIDSNWDWECVSDSGNISISCKTN